MTTKYNINDKVYDTLNKKFCKVNSINIRANGIYYLVEFNNGNLMYREEEHLIKYKPILDKTEKRYLKDVIRPFRNKICYIVKRYDDKVNKEYLEIKFDNEFSLELPYFDKRTMYKNMALCIPYSLEDLDLI